FPSLLGTIAFGISNPFWELANVSEMYSLGVLCFVALMMAVFVWKDPFLTAFLMGLSLGVRMDLLLLIPFVFYFVITRTRPVPSYKTFLAPMGFFFTLGLSVFLYLMIRSRQNPVLDWGNPETLTALFNSVTRKSYSGTLDLLSLSYEKGENF